MNVPKQQTGQGLVEYALIIALVAVVVIAVLLLVGPGVGNVFKGVSDGMEGTVHAHGTQIAMVFTDTVPVEVGTSAVEPTPEERATPTAVNPGHDNDALFYDSFTPEVESEWKWQEVGWRKDWEEKDGYYYGGTNGGGQYWTFAGNEDWTDYKVKVKANLLKGNGYGIYFRASDPKAVNAYVLQYDPGYGQGEFLFRRVEDGKESRLFAREKPAGDFDWHDQESIITIEVRGDTFTASVDGEPLLTGQDSNYAQGSIGLRTWDGTEAAFDYVKVTPLVPET